MYRAAFRLTFAPITTRGYPFMTAKWECVKIWQLTHKTLPAPVKLRAHGWGPRLLLLTREWIEPGTIVSPYEVVCRWLRA